VSSRRALDDLVSDALAAAAAKTAGIDRRSDVTWETTSLLARAVARRSVADAAASGAPTPQELESVEVAHAVVRRSARVPEARAVAVASAIRAAVEGARSVDDFEARAKATPHADSQVVVERLPAFRAVGRSESASFDASFVAAAFGLGSAGAISSVVETVFGWHVIYLVDRKAAEGWLSAEDGARLASAVRELRARAALDSVLRARRQAARIEVMDDADALLAEVKVP
jgi:parvulin-like peptidyl-prolyl isomerase